MSTVESRAVWVAKRAEAVKLWREGREAPEIAGVLGVQERLVAGWCARWEAKGKRRDRDRVAVKERLKAKVEVAERTAEDLERKVARRIYEGASWQEAVQAEDMGAWTKWGVMWSEKLPKAWAVAEAAVAGASELTPARLKAMAARVLEEAERETDLVKRASVIEKVSGVLGNCNKVAKDTGAGEYESMSLTQIQDRIARLAPKGEA